REHHRVDEADPPREPGRPEVRERVEHALGEEERADRPLVDAELLLEEKGQKRRGEEAAGDAVDGEERAKLRQEAAALAADPRARPRRRRRDGAREEEIGRRGRRGE